MQNQIAENGQESRVEAESQKANAYQRQEYHQREYPREEGKGQSAAYVRAGNARLDKVRVDEGEAQADGQMDRDGGVKHIGCILNQDVIGQALKPGRVCLGAGLCGRLNARQREGNAVRDYGSKYHEYSGYKAG